MSRPPTTLTLRYFTTSAAAKFIGIEGRTLKGWIRRGILPEPTYRDEHGTRFFDSEWLRIAKVLVRRVNNEISFEELLSALENIATNQTEERIKHVNSTKTK